MERNDPAVMVKEIQDGFVAFQEAQKETVAQMREYAKATAQGAATEAKAAMDAANASAAKVLALADRLMELEQKVVEGVTNQKAAPESLGVLLTKSEEFNAFNSGKTSKFRVEFNTITGQAGSPVENSDVLVPTQRLPGIIPGAFRALRVADVLPVGTTSSNMVEYTRELAFTNSAAETAEGETKPESAITFELANAPVRTIAHWLKLSRQVVDDAPALASYVDGRLRYGVDQRLDAQLLNGDATGQNISGMAHAGNFTAFTPTTGDTALDSLNRAKYAILGADYAATAIIMNPADWGAVERLKTTDGLYVVGNPFGYIGPILWGLPVVVTNAMTATYFHMAAFDIAYQLWNRQGTVIEMTESNDTDFVKNLITVRAERRAALAVYRPASTRYGALTV